MIIVAKKHFPVVLMQYFFSKRYFKVLEKIQSIASIRFRLFNIHSMSVREVIASTDNIRVIALKLARHKPF